jgi:hypothetical protein
MNQDRSAWRPLTNTELLTGLALFMLPILYTISGFLFGYHSLTNLIRSTLVFATMAFILVVLILAFMKGFPRWTVPFLGIAVTAIVMLEPSWRIWNNIYPAVYRILGGKPSTLLTRITYQALMWGFFWFAVFVACVLLVLLLAAWPRTRRLARDIRQTWTLFSFMLYGGVIFALELVFDEYRYDELWKIACWGCLAAGAWAYLKSASPRQRILALLAGVTLAYWIAAVGKWYLVPLQTWGAFHGHDYETYSRFEFWRTLAEWGWVMFFMLLPALLTRIPRPATADSLPDEDLVPA